MKEVVYAKFHQTVFTAATGNFGDALPSTSKSLKGLKMYADTLGLLVFANNTECLVPWANVAICQFAKTEAVAKAS